MPEDIGRAYADALPLWQEGSLRSARRIVPIVMELLAPSSVIDVGCGIGAWLRVFAEHGVADFIGVDGEYVSRERLLIPSERFHAANLEDGYESDRRFDLVVSLEVGEHLPASCASRYIASLAGLGPAVLFSAAIPGQRGLNHINEQWPSYWGRLFATHGYFPIDPIRTAIWDDDGVELWYRQNTIVYLASELYDRFGDGRWEDVLRPVVHPQLAGSLRRPQDLTLREVVSEFPAAFARSYRHHVSRRVGRSGR